MKSIARMLALVLLAPLAVAQQPQFPADPATGRAIGAKHITPEELRRLIDKKTNTLIIDVRDPDEFEKETIKGAINIPLAQLAPKLKDIPKDATLVFTWNTGRRSSQAAKLAEQAGFKTASFCPLSEYKQKGGSTEAGKKKPWSKDVQPLAASLEALSRMYHARSAREDTIVQAGRDRWYSRNILWFPIRGQPFRQKSQELTFADGRIWRSRSCFVGSALKLLYVNPEALEILVYPETAEAVTGRRSFFRPENTVGTSCRWDLPGIRFCAGV